MNVGGSLTPVTVIVKVWVALVSSPPLAMPPLSWSSIVIVALPTPAAAGVNVSVPVGPTAGWTAKSALSVLFVTENATVWADSFAGPSLIAVAQPGIECAPEFSRTVWFAPLVKDGGSLTAVTVIVNVCRRAVVRRRAAAVVVGVERDRGDAVGIRGGGVGQRARRADRRA